MYPKKELAQIIIAACHQFEIQTIVISPGSRNAPLTIGFSNHQDFEALSIVDERCAAFFALGIAQQSQKPVALVCTSGSAMLNYYPAIAEAFYSQIPLVVISADRPSHLIDIGDGQTIRQENVFQNHILFSANLKENDSEKNMIKLSKAFSLLHKVKGPIHINAPFDEPLYETVGVMNDFSLIKEESDIEVAIDYENLAQQWNSANKKMILVGVHYPNSELEILLDKVADDPSVLVLTETTSNLHNKRFIKSIDNLIFNLTKEEFSDLQPDILLTFGGLIVSKKIKKFLRDYSPSEHWHINELRAFDTYHVLSKHIKADSFSFFENFHKLVDFNNNSNYEHHWTHYKNLTRKKHKQFIKNAIYSDLKVFEKVLKVVPDFSEVQFSNSAIIRYSQLFEMNKTITVFCNRGTSGIDGSTSTAIGAAFMSKKRTTFISGDLSFFYDSNALWNDYIPTNFRIIVINNYGGGIFKIIPGPKESNALKFFETPHCLTAQHLCEMHRLDYCKSHNIETLDKELADFYKESTQPKLLEIFTPSSQNDLVLKEYINSLK